MTRFGLALGAQVLLLAWCGPAAAAALDQDACAQLKTELLQLELAGTRASMAKGPDWAKANLGADKLQQIKRLMEVDEQILFRCQGKPLVVLPEGVDGEAAAVPADRGKDAAAKPAGESKGAAKDALAPAGKAKAGAPAAAKAAGAGAKAPAGTAAGTAKATPEPVATATPPKPKPKPKPKADDAYRPAPAAPAATPGSGKP
jgi:hypothetical protein